MLLALLVACTSSGDDSVTPETPTISFLQPTDGATVAVGKLALSIVVEHFALHDPSKHNEGEPEGYVEVAWTDGNAADSMTTASTTPTIELPTAGSWTISAELYFADGDEISETFEDYVPAAVAVTAQ
jgi:hypothetical protein